MRTLSLASRALVGLGLCGLLSVALRGARRPAARPAAARGDAPGDPAKRPPRTGPLAPCPRPMTPVPPPRCAPVDLGDLVEIRLIPHGVHPQVPHGHDGHGELRFGADGAFRRSSDDPASGCAPRAAMLALAARLERFVPAPAWRAAADVDAASRPARDWYGGDDRLVRVVRVTRAGVRVADVRWWAREIQGALEDFFAQNASHEGLAREAFNRSTAPAASLSAHWVVCGHCGIGELTASVREDGWFVYERMSYHDADRFAGRFDPAQARAFVGCLRDRDALSIHLSDASQFFPGGDDDPCESTRAWRGATGFSLPSGEEKCRGTEATPPGVPGELE